MQSLIWLATIAAVGLSYRIDKARTKSSLRKGLVSLKSLSFGLFWMIAGVGLILAVVPEEKIVSIFTMGGFWSFVLVSLVGAVLTLPGPIAFPMAGTFLKMGADATALASFISTLTMVGLATLPLEISYFGKRFALVRQAFSFLAAILIGLVVGVLI